MGKSSRDKGKRGEREFAALLRSLGFDEARRTVQYCGNTGDADDVAGVEGLHFEVKRCETTKIGEWTKQAARDCTDTNKVPVVAHRRNGEPWLITIPAIDFLLIYKDAQNGEKRQQEEKEAHSE